MPQQLPRSGMSTTDKQLITLMIITIIGGIVLVATHSYLVFVGQAVAGFSLATWIPKVFKQTYCHHEWKAGRGYHVVCKKCNLESGR